MKEMVLRFDEVLSDKLNKITLEQYQRDAKATFLS